MTGHNPTNSDTVRFGYEGREIHFRSVAPDDHILETMRRRGTFYEIDVLERLRKLLGSRRQAGSAVDVGAFIGTHSVYLARFCGCSVRAYEPNPRVFPILVENLTLNGVCAMAVAFNVALSARAGEVSIAEGPARNLGNTSVMPVAKGKPRIRAARLDAELQEAGNDPVEVIKIDVEGSELDVVAGAAMTIRRHRPILCIEVHTFTHLCRLLIRLRGCQYWIADCLGFSPTYLLQSSKIFFLRRLCVNGIWLLHALAPATHQWRFARLARRIVAVDPAQTKIN